MHGYHRISACNYVAASASTSFGCDIAGGIGLNNKASGKSGEQVRKNGSGNRIQQPNI